MDPRQLAQAIAPHIGEPLSVERARQIMLAALGAAAPILPPPEPKTCGRLTFAVERLEQILGEIHPLHEAHWQETERHRHGIALDPDYMAMILEERAGTMLQFTARADGALVGNLRVYLRTSRHTGTLFASEDALYLSPEFRAGRNAWRFVEFAEAHLKTIGVREIRCDTKTINGTDRFMQGMGYQPVAVQLVKILSE